MTARTVALGSIARITSGGTPDRENPTYWGGTVPWVKTTLVQNCEIGLDDIDEKITEAGVKSSSAKLIPAGSILMAMVGQGKTRGQVAVLTIDAAINQNCAAIILRDEAHCRYVYQQLLFRYEAIRNASNSSGQQNLNAGLIRELRMPLPKFAEQAKIAEILSTWDAAIQKTEKLIAAKERQHAALIMKIMNTLDKSGSVTPRVPLMDVADRVRRQSDGNEYPLLTISSAYGFIRQEDRYSRYMAGESAKTYTLLARGEFSYNKGNSKRYEFGCVFQQNAYDAALVPSVYVSFRVNDNVSAEYLGHLFAADYLKPQLRALVKTGVRNNGLLNISPDDFLGTTIPLPPLARQQQIARVLDASRKETALLQEELSLLRNQKRGLMQKLLTGQWRLPVRMEETA